MNIISNTSKPTLLLLPLMLACGLAEAESTKAESNITALIGPRIRFANPVFDFGKVKSGEPARHTFFFTNCGDSLLVISNVQPQCGCTTAGEWTRNVEPGGFGSVPIQFNTLNYNGQVLKNVTILCNDNTQPPLRLQIKGHVWKPIEVQPAFAVLNIPADATNAVSTTVHIVNNMDEPLTLSNPEPTNKMLRTQLKTNIANRDFSLVITAVPPFEQPKSQWQVKLESSSTNLPPINVWANVQPQKIPVSQTNVVFVPHPK